MTTYLLCSVCVLVVSSNVGAFTLPRERPARLQQNMAPTIGECRGFGLADTKAHGFRLPRTCASSLSRTSLRTASSSSSEVRDNVATVQILMSDTGGGHRASANALRDAFDEIHPGKIEVDIVDIYTDYGPFFPYDSYVQCYKIMAEYDFLWKAFYEFGCTPFGLWLNEFLLELFCFEPFKKCMARPSGSTDRRADMVVSVHPLCQDVPLKILSSLDTDGETRRPEARTTPFVTVVTDLGGAHPTWFNPGVDKCFVPSDALHRCALDRKVRPEQIVQHGLPIRRGFWGEDLDAASASAERSKSAKERTRCEELREKLGLVHNIPSVLVVGGGDGMGGIVETARALGGKLSADSRVVGSDYQLVVVCGNNKKAKDELSATKWDDGVHVKVEGFVNNMDEYMRACDALVTKAGPGTIAEASICGLPCMLSAYLPGQEEGNIPYVEENGFGTYSGSATKIASTVSSWLESPEKMKSMREAALRASRPHATLDIAKDLSQILLEHKKNNP